MACQVRRRIAHLVPLPEGRTRSFLDPVLNPLRLEVDEVDDADRSSTSA